MERFKFGVQLQIWYIWIVNDNASKLTPLEPVNDWKGGGGMKIFTYIAGGYENVSIGFWEGMEICTWNFIYPPTPSSNYFMTGP